MSPTRRTLITYAVVVVLVAVAAWFVLAKPLAPQPVTAGPPTTTTPVSPASESRSTPGDGTTVPRATESARC